MRVTGGGLVTGAIEQDARRHANAKTNQKLTQVTFDDLGGFILCSLFIKTVNGGKNLTIVNVNNLHSWHSCLIEKIFYQLNGNNYMRVFFSKKDARSRTNARLFCPSA